MRDNPEILIDDCAPHARTEPPSRMRYMQKLHSKGCCWCCVYAVCILTCGANAHDERPKERNSKCRNTLPIPFRRLWAVISWFVGPFGEGARATISQNVGHGERHAPDRFGSRSTRSKLRGGRCALESRRPFQIYTMATDCIDGQRIRTAEPGCYPTATDGFCKNKPQTILTTIKRCVRSRRTSLLGYVHDDVSAPTFFPCLEKKKKIYLAIPFFFDFPFFLYLFYFPFPIRRKAWRNETRTSNGAPLFILGAAQTFFQNSLAVTPLAKAYSL